MKKRKKRSRGPWVVEQEHLVNWLLNKMPVRYKWKTMYIDHFIRNGEGYVSIYQVDCKGRRTTENRVVLVDEIDLLIA